MSLTMFFFSWTQKMFLEALLVLVLLPGMEAQLLENGPYMVRSLGFINMFSRSEPFLLFQHDTGVMLFNDNESCWNAHSVYYPLIDANEIKYIHYSPGHNYLVYYDKPDSEADGAKLCFRNLLKSKWNEIMFESVGIDRCGELGKSFEMLTINHARRAVYVHNEGYLEVLPFFHNSDCQYKIAGDFDSTNLQTIHVTNFEDSVDYLIICSNYSIQRFTAAGLDADGPRTVKFKKGYNFKMIDSDSLESVFVILQQDSTNEYTIQKYNMRHWPKSSVVNEAQIPSSVHLFGFSVITGLMVFAYEPSDQPRNLTISFVPLNEMSEYLRFQAWTHTCRPSYFPDRLILVNLKPRPHPLSIIKENPKLLDSASNLVVCQKDLFESRVPEIFNQTELYYEIWRKLNTILALTIMALIVSGAYYLLENQEYSQ